MVIQATRLLHTWHQPLLQQHLHFHKLMLLLLLRLLHLPRRPRLCPHGWCDQQQCTLSLWYNWMHAYHWLLLHLLPQSVCCWATVCEYKWFGSQCWTRMQMWVRSMFNINWFNMLFYQWWWFVPSKRCGCVWLPTAGQWELCGRGWSKIDWGQSLL